MFKKLAITFGIVGASYGLIAANEDKFKTLAADYRRAAAQRTLSDFATAWQRDCGGIRARVAPVSARDLRCKDILHPQVLLTHFLP